MMKAFCVASKMQTAIQRTSPLPDLCAGNINSSAAERWTKSKNRQCKVY